MVPGSELVALALFVTCCISQYMRGRILRYDFGDAGLVEEREINRAKKAAIEAELKEREQQNRRAGIHYIGDVRVTCGKQIEHNGVKIWCTRTKNHTGMHVVSSQHGIVYVG